MRQRSLAGEGTKDTSTGTYAKNKPFGFRMSYSIHFNAAPKFKFAPAESPTKRILSPVDPKR